MSNPPTGGPPPPPPPPGTPSGPAPYPGTGYQGGSGPTTGSASNVYTWDATPPGQIRTASYGARATAFVIDTVLLSILPVAAVVTIREGGRDIRSCDLTADGDIAVFGQDAVTSGLCEYPSSSAIAIAGTLFLLGVAVWFAHHAREGRTGTTVGKSVLKIRTVERASQQPIGAGKGIGRGLFRALLGWPTFGVGFVLDHLWPLWDRDQQALHDKVTGAVVIPATDRTPADRTAADRTGGAPA